MGTWQQGWAQAAGRAVSPAATGEGLGCCGDGGGEGQGARWVLALRECPTEFSVPKHLLWNVGFFKTLDTDLDGVVTFDLFKVGTCLGCGRGGCLGVTELSHLPAAGACGLRPSPKGQAS